VADGPIVDPRDKDKKDDKNDDRPGDKDKPVTILARGNRLIVTSDDPKALVLVQQLIRIMTETPKGEGDYEIIRLKNANAADAAKVIDEVFNGPKQPPAQPQGGGRGLGGGGGGRGALFNPFAAPGATTPAKPEENRVRVVADTGSNSLIIRASPLDMLTIRKLLEGAIDSDNPSPTMRSYVIGPLKYASAVEVAGVLMNVYREYTNQNPRFGGNSILSGFSNRNIGPDGQARAVTLSVGVDDRTNSIIVSCTEPLYKDIKLLVNQLEMASRDTTRKVELVSLKGVDPAIVQQALQAIQGRVTQTMPVGTDTGMQGGGGFGPGGGGGGFMGGGGGFPGGGGGFGPGGGRGGFGGGFPGGGGGFGPGGGFGGGGFPGGGGFGGGGRGFGPGGGGGFGGGRGFGPPGGGPGGRRNRAPEQKPARVAQAGPETATDPPRRRLLAATAAPRRQLDRLSASEIAPRDFRPAALLLAAGGVAGQVERVPSWPSWASGPPRPPRRGRA
jgi:hypothetical protein